jgi:glucokinase
MHFNLGINFPIRFVFDSTAFITGEACFGAAKAYNRIIGITLGTGIGSAFMIGKKIIEKGEGLPPDGASYLFNMPYDGGIVEDKISKKAIICKYKNLGGKCSKDMDVDKIDRLAAGGDKTSLEVFKDFGVILGRVLRIVALNFRPECIVFGGGISKGFYLFAEPLKMELKGISGLKKITPGKLGDLSALYGVVRFFQLKE